MVISTNTDKQYLQLHLGHLVVQFQRAI